MSNFRSTDRQTGFLMPPSVDELLPQRHLARFVVEVVDGLDLKAMSKSYRGSGSASCHPAVLLGLLIYGCATDVSDGMSILEELERRETRLAKLVEARAKIAARANERHAREQAEYEAKVAARAEKAKATGKRPGGKPPQPPALPYPHI